MTKRYSELTLLILLASCSTVFAQVPAPPEEPATPTTLIERAETRIVRVEILASSTRSMHSHPDMLWHVFTTMDAPMILTIQGEANPVKLGPWQSHFLVGGTMHAITNPNPRPVQFLEFFSKNMAASGAGQAVGPAPGESLSQSYRGSQGSNVEYQKIPPIRVFDNLYYVGPGSVSVWLIPTTDGLILIDSAQEPYVDHVIDNIRTLGFDPGDIKYILITHGHLDHFGGAGKIQALSGARVATLEEDWQLIEAATLAAVRPDRPLGVPLKRDLVLREGQTVTLGKTSLKVYKLPGHTAGSPSFEFTVYDGPRAHKALVFGGPGQRNGVEGGSQFLSSIRRLKAEMADVEVPLHVHSWLSTYPYPSGGAVFEPAMKLAERKAGEPHPFVDNALWRRWLDVAEAGAITYIEDAHVDARSAP
jgi:metallo-beta-lactamase class B